MARLVDAGSRSSPGACGNTLRWDKFLRDGAARRKGIVGEVDCNRDSASGDIRSVGGAEFLDDASGTSGVPTTIIHLRLRTPIRYICRSCREEEIITQSIQIHLNFFVDPLLLREEDHATFRTAADTAGLMKQGTRPWPNWKQKLLMMR